MAFTNLSLADIKRACRVSGDAYDDDLGMLLAAAVADLTAVRIPATATTADPLIARAIITYCKMHHFGPADSGYDRLVRSYDLQRKQLLLNHAYFPDEEA